MLRTIIVIGFIGLIDQSCRGDAIGDTTEDWRKQGLYRPRRNFPSQSRDDNSFQNTFRGDARSAAGTNLQQNPGSSFGINNYQNSQKQNSFGFGNKQHSIGVQIPKSPDTPTAFNQNQRAFAASYQNAQNKESNNSSQSGNAFIIGQASFQSAHTQIGGQNAFGSRVSQNLEAPVVNQNFLSQSNNQHGFPTYNQNDPNQNSFRRFNQNNRPFGNFGQKFQNQNAFGNFQSQHSISSIGSNNGFANNYRAPDYLPPKPFKGPEYLPPEKPKTSRIPFYISTTKRPHFTSTTRRPQTTTRRQFYTTTSTKRPFYTTTKRPFFTTTTIRPTYTTSFRRTTKYNPLPAMAMPVPIPDDDDDENIPDTRTKPPPANVAPAMAMIVPPEPEDDPTTTTIRPIFTTSTKRTTFTPKYLPAMAMPVPDPDDDDDENLPDTITKPPAVNVAPAMAMIVPPEPEDDPTTISTTSSTTTSTTPSTTTTTQSTTTTSTTLSTTISTTPSTTTTITTPTTISTTPSTTTTSTTPSTTTSTTTSTTPSTTTSTTPSTTTTTSTPSTSMITTPSSTISTTVTTPSTTTTISTTRELNRNLIEEESIATEATSTTAVVVTSDSTTTIKPPYVGPAYLPPDDKVASTTTSTTTVDPKVVAEKVPEESACDPLDPKTWPTEYEQRNFGELPCAPGMKISPEPAPARADPVPPEPECDPQDPSTWPTDIDQRDFGETPCAPITITSSTTTTTTTPSTTTSTTPSTTTSTTPPTTTSTTSSTTTSSTTPSTTTSTTPSTTFSTTPSTTTSTTSSTTTTSTTPSTTTSTTQSTTFSTTPSTTISTTPSTTTTSTTPSTTILTTPSTISTTSTTTTTPKPPFIGREYLPPTNNITTLRPPAPPIVIEVPPEPECDPLYPSTWPSEVDQREFGDKSCAPNITKKPFIGLEYLPPDECIPKTRYRRSSNETLKLADLKGTPRPVWHVGIYKKTTDPYFPICGGSIVREDIVISAAHCFWDDVVGLQSAALFAVAASKIYKPWKDPMDKKAQKSDVLDIKIPARFLGAKTSFQEDIAIMKLATPFKYTRGVRPICVDFDDDFDRQQMKAGYQGTIAGWGLTDSKGTPTQRLLWLELPYIEIERCIQESEDAFLKYITCDKVCAGENDTGKSLCKGDSGGGLAFWAGPASHATPYLRGVASTAPSPRNAECNVYAYGSFTHVRSHRTFLRDHVPDVESCRFWE